MALFVTAKNWKKHKCPSEREFCAVLKRRGWGKRGDVRKIAEQEALNSLSFTKDRTLIQQTDKIDLQKF